MNEYKESIKNVDPTFDGDYYDRLISGEPLTLAPADSVETPEDEAKQDVTPSAEQEQEKGPDQSMLNQPNCQLMLLPLPQLALRNFLFCTLF